MAINSPQLLLHNTRTYPPSDSAGDGLFRIHVYMLVEVKDSYGNVTVRSGGQDGVAHWLNKNGMKLSWKALKQGNPDSDLKFKSDGHLYDLHCKCLCTRWVHP